MPIFLSILFRNINCSNTLFSISRSLIVGKIVVLSFFGLLCSLQNQPIYLMRIDLHLEAMSPSGSYDWTVQIEYFLILFYILHRYPFSHILSDVNETLCLYPFYSFMLQFT